MSGYSDSAHGHLRGQLHVRPRPWTASATDDLSNSASATCDQTILNDNTPPTVTIDCPDDYTVNADADCNADTTPASAGEATGSASDNCDAGVMATVSYSDGAHGHLRGQLRSSGPGRPAPGWPTLCQRDDVRPDHHGQRQHAHSDHPLSADDLECGASMINRHRHAATDNLLDPDGDLQHDEVETTACVVTVTRTWMAEETTVATRRAAPRPSPDRHPGSPIGPVTFPRTWSSNAPRTSSSRP